MKSPPKYHLLVLWGFAVAQPLYDLMGRYPAFLSAHHLTGRQIVVLAVMLSFVFPILLWGMLRLVDKVHRATGMVLHSIVTAGLLALIVYAAVWKLEMVPWVIAGIIGTLTWLLALWGYAATGAGRSVVTVLSPAVIVFPTLFIFTEPVSKYLFPPNETPKTSAAPAKSMPPIVIVVFDELPTSVLTEGGPSIDAERFPNFDKLAKGSYWFRNATTVDTRTESALPAILTGRYKIPGRVRAPTVNEYPDNLFTRLWGVYQMRVSEPLTDLCPADVCSRSLHGDALRTMHRLVLDLRTVYMHIVTPPPWRAKLPPINQAWADFGIFRMDERAADLDNYGRRRQAREFINSIEVSSEPIFYFMHSNLPHMPYEYFPSGTVYYRHALIRGIDKHNNLDVWSDDPLAVAEAKRRFVLQVRFVDRIVGELITRLQQQSLYDEALIVITADHGVSIRAGDLRRGISDVNQRDIAGVPLFIKIPKQRRGVISDRNVELVDILPAIADVLGLSLDWPMDGRTPFTGPDRVHKTVFDGWRRWQLPPDLMVPSDRTRRRWDEDIADRRFAGNLIGKHLDQLDVERTEDRSAVVMKARLYSDVQRDSFVPAHVVGHVSGKPGQVIAVALNGRIEAVTRTYPHSADGRTEFSALLPEQAFNEGDNRLTVLRVDRVKVGLPRLTQIY